MDTIFAEATPPGRGGVSVVRVSGPDSRAYLESLAGPIPEARRSYLRALRDGDDLIDRSLVIRFDSGKSFTGEDVAEFHLHGAPVIANRLSAALLSFGARRAEAGEFTRRAFVNGVMDLSEAEGLADLLAAETEAQRKLAVKLTDGELGGRADALRSKLIRAGALIEASIDFADEEVPEDVPAEVFALVADVRTEVVSMLSSYPATERLRQGYEVAIIGPPNAGKSTLINRIAQRELALVSDIAGTTRDVIELHTDLRGLPVTFLDTAGLRESVDVIEAMGIARATERATNADLRIKLYVDGEDCTSEPEQLLVRSKADVVSGDGLEISAATGEGVAELLDIVYNKLRERAASAGLIGHRRQADALVRASGALKIDETMPPELLAEQIRQAVYALSEMVGRVGVEDYLDEIFSSFCIGK
ncbi:tRNA uridine-5-carboxymethylaminomethyl(34) synthesis GTPase MnmE [Paracoccus aestuariivivens]|uniref:tRNA modification GTPase MnmE n=1 Tax=Paracoccus aestuariivivens TaxID=1820333 RepID=A0A6L6J9R8_9RHOB|nr:tRNA uridine-5-carboxymethylaminomethyl(34) synthesis GTPase MnmE [Paracoccus aestuariivivens]MTH78286.1 tRNA uridine-5-carboxymethylaminomethyl(34) synthesis GTPase MnmE [Paracoccus aestuariivivens]